MVKEVEGRPAKTAITAISPQIAKNWRNCSFCISYLIQVVKGVEGRPAKTVISAISPKIAKNWGNRRIC